MLSRYDEWLQFVFDRPEVSWYFELEDPDFEADKGQIALLVAQTLESAGRDLEKYSQEQIGYGLCYIFDASCSNVVFSLMDEEVPMGTRLRAIKSIKTLYRDYLTPKCAPVLVHTGGSGANQLSYICYMLWDISPLSFWENRPDRCNFYDAVVDVLEDALTSSNPACVGSALHGLGHIHSSHIERVENVIAAYLRRNVFVSPQLKEYAQRAATGNVL